MKRLSCRSGRQRYFWLKAFAMGMTMQGEPNIRDIRNHITLLEQVLKANTLMIQLPTITGFMQWDQAPHPESSARKRAETGEPGSGFGTHGSHAWTHLLPRG